MSYKLIIFDMDGVIFKHKNFWLELHKRLGTYEEGLALTKELLYTDYQKLAEAVVGRLWKGKDAKPYFDLIEESEYLPGVKETLLALKEQGYKTAIISSGPKHLALKAAGECDMDYYHAQELLIGDDGRFTGEIIHKNVDDKTKELEQFANQAGCTVAETVYVGHDDNDIKPLKKAGLGIAYRPENKEVENAADMIINSMDELPGLL